jgi:DNA repair protein RadC
MFDSMIADLPIEDRPRERMHRHGVRTMSDADLLAILLGSGTEGKNAIELAREMLDDGGGVPMMARNEVDQLTKTRGVGLAKAARIAAAFELGRRSATQEVKAPLAYEPKALARKAMARMRDYVQEHLMGIFLDSRGHVLREREIYIGTIDRAIVSTRDVLKFALDANATGVVLYHNHPSGDVTPSAEDREFTDQMSQCLQLANMRLVDHLIIGRKVFASLKGSSVY